MFAIRHSQQKVTPQMVMRLIPNSSLIKYALGIGAATALCGVAFSGAAVAEGEQPQGISQFADADNISGEALARAVEPLFDDDDYAETRAVLIMQDGKVVAERYAPGYDENTRFVSWSMAKTVTGVLVGIMIADGRLVLDDPAPVPEWLRPGDPRGAITLRHLLHMSSGLDHVEAGNPPYESDEVRALFTDAANDAAGYAKAETLAAEPGATYQYSTNTSVILSDIITRQLTDSKDPKVRQKAMADFIEGRLIEPLGLDSFYPEYDASGTMLGGSLIHASALDWAKFGEFLRNKGAVDGSQILPREYVDFMLTPSSTDPAYGGHLWLNRSRPEGRGVVLFPGNGPDNVFAMLGHLGQQVIVSPNKRVTMVRLGKTQDDVGRPLHIKMGQILAAM